MRGPLGEPERGHQLDSLREGVRIGHIAARRRVRQHEASADGANPLILKPTKQIADREESVNQLKARWQAEQEALSRLKPLQEEVAQRMAAEPGSKDLQMDYTSGRDRDDQAE